ncbi:hypothetical protein [Burkholderia sp. Ac-20365]|uniref:hypothetical protein n=1 Tax=Burkholderia sp. Ac-20365 TaxID=2703897 RepID=UPI00197B7710|nr:hypothetical protein [Burkholderia sp. Ac-20365]MBN3760545.1 hypothetical protein [Burkholderia sp. Ac-20365]
MRIEDFEQQLTAILQSAGPGTVAELTDTAIAYWNGIHLVYAEIDIDGTGALTGAFEMNAQRWTQWKDWLSDWLTDPVISVRHDLSRAN